MLNCKSSEVLYGGIISLNSLRDKPFSFKIIKDQFAFIDETLINVRQKAYSVKETKETCVLEFMNHSKFLNPVTCCNRRQQRP